MNKIQNFRKIFIFTVLVLVSCQPIISAEDISVATQTSLPATLPTIAATEESRVIPSRTSILVNPNIINDLQFDSIGNIWLTTDKSVFYWNLVDNTSKQYTACGEIKPVKSMTLDLHGDLWIAMSDSIVHWNLIENKCEEYIPNKGLPEELLDRNIEFHDIIMTPDGALWAAYLKDVLRFENGQWKKQNIIGDGEQFKITLDGKLLVISLSFHILTVKSGIKFPELIPLDIHMKLLRMEVFGLGIMLKNAVMCLFTMARNG